MKDKDLIPVDQFSENFFSLHDINPIISAILKNIQIMVQPKVTGKNKMYMHNLHKNRWTAIDWQSLVRFCFVKGSVCPGTRYILQIQVDIGIIYLIFWDWENL